MNKFRMITENDLPMLLEWRRDPEVCKYLNTIPDDIELQRKWFNNVKDNPSKKYIIFNHNDTDMGLYGLVNIDYDNKKLEIGGYGPEKYLGNGYANIGFACMLHYIFEHMQFNKVYATMPTFNYRSLKMTLRHGMQIEGVLKDWFLYDGKFYDDFIVSILKKDWKNKDIPEYVFYG